MRLFMLMRECELKLKLSPYVHYFNTTIIFNRAFHSISSRTKNIIFPKSTDETKKIRDQSSEIRCTLRQKQSDVPLDYLSEFYMYSI